MTGIIREERIGGHRLILGDCLEVMPLLGKVDAVVTDPPYGIGIELDPDYFEIACRRVDEATRQPDLFVDPAATAPKQEALI